MTTISFQQYWGHASADVACKECGRVSRRRIREWVTVNPFGSLTPLTAPVEAQRRAQVEAERQISKGRTCRLCEAHPKATGAS